MSSRPLAEPLEPTHHVPEIGCGTGTTALRQVTWRHARQIHAASRDGSKRRDDRAFIVARKS